MKIMFRKLNFKRGASLVLALLIFLLCALAGVTALSMAMANVGRFSHAQEDQQPYYTVSSAALLMIDLLDGTEYTSPTVIYNSIREWEHTGDPTKDETAGHPSREYNTLNVLDMGKKYDSSASTAELKQKYLNSSWNTGENKSQIVRYHIQLNKDNEPEEVVDGSNPLNTSNLALLEELRGYCDKLVPYCVVPQEWYDSVRFKDSAGKEQDAGLKTADFRPIETLNYTFTISTGSLSTVTARLVMEDNYNLILSFSCREQYGEKEEDVSFYAVNVYWSATVTTKTESDPTKFEYVADGTVGSMTSEQRKTVTVRWDKKNVTISRGEAYEAK